ncbi:SEL1L3 [Branchiostoma lanceolatum]|uniref:SEL1L3 protein n=1 Tax=Branchiostoma lanceolatum TaxID=7740 RepID=A0A8K0A2K8_BRALA|nr:SEL1L3 [Branchiostoma lanceolatum]
MAALAVFWTIIFATMLVSSQQQQLLRQQGTTGSRQMSMVVDKKSLTEQDFVRVLNAPEFFTATPDLSVPVEYRCSKDRIIGVDVRASSLVRNNVDIFKFRWQCEKTLGQSKVRTVAITLPDTVLYKEDRLVRRAVFVTSMELRVWLIDKSLWTQYKMNHYVRALAKVSYPMQSVPPYSRPPKDHKQCWRWDVKMIDRFANDFKYATCPLEPEVVDFFTFPVAFGGYKRGVVKELPKFKDLALRKHMGEISTKARWTLSVWVYLQKYCSMNLCGLYHKAAVDDFYLTPVIFVTDTGHLFVQVSMVPQQLHAVLSIFKLPLHQWFRLDFTLDGNYFNTTVTYGPNLDKQYFMEDHFPRTVYFDDVSGRHVFGGTDVGLQAIKGFMAHARLYRTHVVPHDVIQIPPASDAMFAIELPQEYKNCEGFKRYTNVKLRHYKILKEDVLRRRVCLSFYAEKMEKYRRGYVDPESICPVYAGPAKQGYATTNALIRKQVAKYARIYSLHDKNLSDQLYQKAIDTVDVEGLRGVVSSIPMLQQSACLRGGHAAYLLSVLYTTGAGVKADQARAWRYGLLAAQLSGKLGLMSIAHKHHFGYDGYPIDDDIAYIYYKNIADQTQKDRDEHVEDDVFTETIRLTDTNALKEITNENDDLFLWLKFQAKKGVTDAQSAMARMLFWGQQGIKRNLQAAFRYYEMHAQQEPKNPEALYDYGIVMLKGQGTEKDVKKAMNTLNKSAELGSPAAINALGWYALNHEGNATKAAHYFHQADRKGNHDAAHNLGHLYWSGGYPGLKKPDRGKAFECYWRSAQRGHIEGSIQSAMMFYNGYGLQERNAYNGAIWARFIAEMSPELGKTLRNGLLAFRQKNWSKSLLFYLLAAEAGLEQGEFNMAYLCEENPEGLAESFIEKDCKWKYYNLSTLAEWPSSYAQIKMGDFHWYGCGGKRDASAAVKMYAKAAVQQDPQGLYNLAYLVGEGVEIENMTLLKIGIDPVHKTSNVTLMSEFYSRCRESRNSDAFIPCSLALARVQLFDIWQKYEGFLKLSSVLGVAMVTSLTAFAVHAHIRANRQDVDTV